MVTKLIPEANKVYFINRYTMFHILEGSGGIQVDFKNYLDWDDKLIFLEKGQYIKFLSGDFVARKIEFDDEDVFKNKDVRILFKHLVSLGYINFLECHDCQKYLNDIVLTAPKNIIDISSKQWYWQNPFNANADEYHIIFDIKDTIDKQFKNHLSNYEMAALITTEIHQAHALVKSKVGVSIKNLLANKRLTETQKEVAFTDKPIKEISYDFGYSDPAYFNRVFKKVTGTTPNEFREKSEYKPENSFIQELYELLNEFHTKKRTVDFYAGKMNLSEKTLSRKVKEELQISIGQLIRQKIIQTCKKLLTQGMSIHEVSYQMGFEEANHFSAFFKHYTSMSPSAFQNKKYKE